MFQCSAGELSAGVLGHLGEGARRARVLGPGRAHVDDKGENCGVRGQIAAASEATCEGLFLGAVGE